MPVIIIYLSFHITTTSVGVIVAFVIIIIVASVGASFIKYLLFLAELQALAIALLAVLCRDIIIYTISTFAIHIEADHKVDAEGSH